MHRCEMCGLFSCDGRCEGIPSLVTVTFVCGHRERGRFSSAAKLQLRQQLCKHCQGEAVIPEEKMNALERGY